MGNVDIMCKRCIYFDQVIVYLLWSNLLCNKYDKIS